MPGTFVAGEMLDWEAPTGGYLLQACFATGAAAGRARRWLGGAKIVIARSVATKQSSLSLQQVPWFVLARLRVRWIASLRSQ